MGTLALAGTVPAWEVVAVQQVDEAPTLGAITRDPSAPGWAQAIAREVLAARERCDPIDVGDTLEVLARAFTRVVAEIDAEYEDGWSLTGPYGVEHDAAESQAAYDERWYR